MAGHRPSVVSTSFLKSRFLETAQTSVYMVKVQPTSSVMAFLSQGSRGVNYNSQDGTNIELLCRETTLPGQSLATADQPNDYPGVTEKMVYRKIYDDRTDFTFYVDKRYQVVEFFEGWIDYCAGQGTTYGRDDYKTRSAYYRMNYPNAYKTDALYITKFEKDVKNSMSYQFIGAFPISIAATPVSYDQSDILKCTVSFSYMRYLRRRSGSGSERTGFMQRNLRAEKSWYTPNYRSYKDVNAGPVNSKNSSSVNSNESSFNPWDLDSSIFGSYYGINDVPSYDIDYNGSGSASDIDFTAGFDWNTKSNESDPYEGIWTL
jgi:hypothetical protein